MGTRRKHKSGFGTVRKLPSGRYQARYVGADTQRHSAPVTFDNATLAWNWLQRQSLAIADGTWAAPGRTQAPDTFGQYAERWLRERDLKPSTRALYKGILDGHILPEFGAYTPAEITPAAVRRWHAELGKQTGPTRRAHSYDLLRVIMRTAVDDELVPQNPCRITGAGHAKRASTTKPASLEELEVIVGAMPEHYRAMVLIAAWCALRLGELLELRRGDLDLTNGVIHVRRAVVNVKNGAKRESVVGTPKSSAGIRSVTVPPHLVSVIREHVKKHAQWGRDGLVFPSPTGGHLAQTSVREPFYKARAKAGRPDLRFHDLRHTGAVLAAISGATLAELMGRLGHTTPQAAMRYQHATSTRDAYIAGKLSELAGGGA